MADDTPNEVRERVRARYATAATAVVEGAAGGCCAPSEAADCCGGSSVEVGEGFGAALYGAEDQAQLPAEAVAASLGCGNPLAVAELQPGETVLISGVAEASRRSA